MCFSLPYDPFSKEFILKLDLNFDGMLCCCAVILMQNGMTPLHLAIWYSLRAEDCLTVKTLLEYNADCSAKDNVCGLKLIGLISA